MKLEKRKLNDGSYEYYWGYNIVDCAEEIGTEKTPVFVYADYYQFGRCLTRLIFSTKKISEYSHSDGDLTLVFTTTMWKKGINIFTEETKKFKCPRCGRITNVLVCENNVPLSEGGNGYMPRTDGCGKCIDKYNVWYRIPIEVALAD